MFPAFFRPAPAALPGEDLTTTAGAEGMDGTDGEAAACFFHARKRAAVPCDRCGRFLCRLCDLGFGDGRHLCPECLRAGWRDGQMPELVNGRPVRDRLALVLAVVGAPFTPLLLLLDTPSWIPLAVILGLFSLPPTGIALLLTLRHAREAVSRGDGGGGPAPTTVGPRVRYLIALVLAATTLLGWTGWIAYRIAFGF